MKKIVLIIFLFFNIKSAFTQDLNQNIYSGGMLILQPGYIFSENEHQKIQNYSYGLGGILRFYFYKHLTIGIYGGTQKTKYKTFGSENSYLSIGYGGPIIGFSGKVNKIRYTFSAFVGKGTIRNLHIESQNSSILTDAHFYKESSIIYSPVLSIDYTLSQRLHLTIQTVCLTAKTNNDKTIYNPTLQFGILFNR